MTSVSSPEDVKPPLGLNGVMKVPAQPTGTSLSLTKHICAICGDRSSGETYISMFYISNVQVNILCYLATVVMDELLFQVNTTACTAAKVAKASSSAR